MSKRSSVQRQCLTALGAVLNIITAFVAMTLRLPIYLDSTGTVLISALLGPKYGIVTGILGSVLSGFTFDVYSFYFAPVQILTALTASWVMRSDWGKGLRMILSGLVVAIPTSLASAAIAAFVFGGQTSSGSSYLVAILHNLGLGLTVSCFVVQILTDYLDKLAAMLLTRLVVKKGVLKKYGTL